jgi:hypothetical protein
MEIEPTRPANGQEQPEVTGAATEQTVQASEDEPSGRLAGCESTNHEQCYGELWQCAACHKMVCYAEGTDDHKELCDDCWMKHQEENRVRI